MKIAMMVRGFLQTPVPNDIAYSPATVAKSIAEGLEAIGHTITFFGPEGTDLNVSSIETLAARPVAKTQNELDEFVNARDLFKDYQPALYDAVLVKDMMTRAAAGEFDCVVFHHFESALPYASMFPDVPVVYVLHDFIDSARREHIELHSAPNQHFISISNSQRNDAPDLNYAATVHNGIDTDMFVPDGEAEDYLMISGRVTSDKGVKEAVQVALQTDRRLLIAGSLSQNDAWYFDENIKPYLNNKILFLGMLEREQLVKYYQKAAALLVPIQWQEPFGLSMAEAGACGAPVIAFNRGAVSEVVEDGKTGFIVNNSAEMIMAVEKLSSIKRENCRNHVLRNFSIKQMVEQYDTALRDIIGDPNERNERPSMKETVNHHVRKITRLIN